jgi:xylulokinase
MFWDFKENRVAQFLLDYYGIPSSFIPDIVPTFSEQSRVSQAAADELGLKAGTPITYRGGDQPNNALSLNVFEPGEIAATAGTSGVVYGVLGDINYDEKSRVNVFAHVNHKTLTQPNSCAPFGSKRPKVERPVREGSEQSVRLGVLLCINGTGILNAWMHRNVTFDMGYAEMNDLAAQAPIGSEGVCILPFGNGAERVLQNQELGCSIHGLNFNKHNRAHLVRAAQEGIVFSFCYGMEIMQQMGMDIRKIHAGKANMFLSPLFRNTLAGVSGATIELFETDGSVGAAKGAGMGAGIYKDNKEAFATLERLQTIEPDEAQRDVYRTAYQHWKEILAVSSK